jgi:hypothetical protein
VRRAALFLIPLAILGLVGAVVAVGGRDSDASFAFHQEHPTTVSAIELQALIKKAPEPVAGGNGSRALDVTCAPGRLGPRRNPWSCRVRYASGRRTTYRVVVDERGRYRGSDRTGERIVNGCCVLGGRTAAG